VTEVWIVTQSDRKPFCQERPQSVRLLGFRKQTVYRWPTDGLLMVGQRSVIDA